MSTANNVVDDNAGRNLALVNVLAKHTLSVFLLRPVNLLRAQRIADTKRHRNPAGTGTDDSNPGEAARNISIQSKLSAQGYGQDSRRIVVTKSQRHLKIMRRVLVVRVNEMTLTKSARACQDLHYGIRRWNQFYHVSLLRDRSQSSVVTSSQ